LRGTNAQTVPPDTNNGERRVRIRIDPSDLALEIISIVVAILLALAGNALVGQLQTNWQVERARASITQELGDNAQSIARVHPRHVAKCQVLQRLAQRGADRRISYTDYQNALGRVLPLVVPPLESTAWTIAVTSNVSSNFDYGTRADLTRLYNSQQRFLDLSNDLQSDFRPLVFTRDLDFFLVARNAALDCSYVVAGESRLSTAYGQEAMRLK